MKVYIKKHNSHAGKWIYAGYKSAWEYVGYDVVYYSNLDSIHLDNEYYLMAIDSDITMKNISKLNKSKATFLFSQPNTFPLPWGTHPNFISHASDEVIRNINMLDNVWLWTFGDLSPTDKKKYFHKWKDVNTLPLAFDSINYKPRKNKNFEYDICFVGGWANNGFNEKKKIMVDVFSQFQKTRLKCGFFVNKGISHNMETEILSSSKVCLNIHDAYQRKLGLDTNERTFKSLGLNGLLVSDKIGQVSNLFPNIRTSLNPKDILMIAEETLSLTLKKQEELKEKNIANILLNHCYINRVQRMVDLWKK